MNTIEDQEIIQKEKNRKINKCENKKIAGSIQEKEYKKKYLLKQY